jgi:hypothetical protein
MKKRFAILSLVSGLGLSHAGIAQDRPAVHGMLVVGMQKIYLSHLPMYHRPHDYQVIFEAGLSTGDKASYVQDRAAHPEETVYTLVPEPFVLPDLVGHPHPIHADLYRGHFERGGVPILQGITVGVESVIHFHKLDPQAPHPAVDKYLAFGQAGGETFLAHLISGKPDFDELIEAPGLQGPLPRVIESAETPAGKVLYLETGDLSD